MINALKDEIYRLYLFLIKNISLVIIQPFALVVLTIQFSGRIHGTDELCQPSFSETLSQAAQWETYISYRINSQKCAFSPCEE